MADFYHDNNVSLRIAELLRISGHRVVTARDVGLDRAKDDEHFLFAAERSLVLVTHDQEDFSLLHDAWRRWSRAWSVPAMHAGVLVLAQLDPSWNSRTADAVAHFVTSNPRLSNTLHWWRPAHGWQIRA